jgi:hypothetical protein
MGHSVLVWAEVVFPPGARARWERLSLADGEQLDWTDASLLSESTDAVTVSTALEALRGHARREGREGRCSDFVSFDLGDAGLSLRARFGEDAFLYWGGIIATLVRLAGTAGARGELAAMTEEGDAERVVLEADGGRVEAFFAGDMGEVVTDLDYEALFDEVFAEAERRTRSPAEAELHAAAARKKKRPRRSR